MTREEVIQEFQDNHRALVEYIKSLSASDFVFSQNGKWTPGQQLDHVLKCVIPLAKGLSAKAVIEAKFGKIQRPVWGYDEVIENYHAALENGGKAPEKFLPERVELAQRDQLGNDLMSTIEMLKNNLNNYSEGELDTLVLPHPLLGNLTIREMLYLMTYHAEHHQAKTKENLG